MKNETLAPDLKAKTTFADVVTYLNSDATDSEKSTAFDLIGFKAPTYEFEGIEVNARGLHDEMAIDKVREYIEINGIQALAELI